MKIQCMGRSMPGIRMFSCKDRRNTAGIQCARSDIKQQLHECCGHEWQKITAFQEKLHFVIGMLNPDGTLDTERMAELIKVAGNKEKALHRAFDVCIDPTKALEEAIELGFDTILTSGQKETAWEGKEMLKALQEKSAGRIEILAASGIGAESIEKLLPYTGITSYHMSGKIVVGSMMKYRKEGIGLGLSERGDYALWQTSEEEIVKAVKVLKTTG